MNHPGLNGHSHKNHCLIGVEPANKCRFRRKYISTVNPMDNTVSARFETEDEAIDRAKKELIQAGVKV